MRRNRTVTKPDRVKLVQSFLSDSINDYIASRVLFMAQLPQQGAILSSTAIEKSLKAILAFQGNVSHGHLKQAHWNGVRNFDVELFKQLDHGFLELNRKAYLLRYTDDLPSGFNLVIASREFLAELDKTMAAIHGGISLEESGEARQTKYNHLAETKDPRLLAGNHVLSGIAMEKFIFAEPQFIYEVRNDGARGLVEVTYSSSQPAKEAGFLRAGFVPKDNEHMSYDLSHFPLPPMSNG